MLKRYLFVLPIFIVVLVFWAFPSLAQVDTAWVRRYNGPANASDWALSLAVDRAGNVYVTGVSSYDYATIKYYPNGDTAWARRYNGSGNSADEACAVALDSFGDVYVTGRSIGSGTGFDYVTIKYYPNGDTAWLRRYNGPGNDFDYAHAIAVDAPGNAYVTGMSCGIGTASDYASIKYYPDGDTAWVRRYNVSGDSHDVPFAIAIDHSGNVYVTGYSEHTSYPYNTECVTVKYCPNGDTAWARRYHGPGDDHYDQTVAIDVDDSGNVYVCGWIDSSWVFFDYVTMKYYPNGDTAWVRRYPNGRADAIAVDGSGNVYVTGTSYSDYATIKYYPDGDTAWVRTYSGPGKLYDNASAITLDGSNNVYVTGESNQSTFPHYNSDYATIKYDPNGNGLWVQRYNGPADSTDRANGIAVDDSGNVYVTGESEGGGTYDDYATIKYYQPPNEPPNSFSLLFPPNKAFTPRVVRFDWETATDPDPFDQIRYDLHLSTSYQFPPDQTTIDADLTTSEYIKTLDYGTHYWKVKAKDNWGTERWSNQTRYFMVTGIPYSGDVNLDGSVDVGDVAFLINYLYTSGPAPDPLELGDVNCDNEVNIGDVIFLINFLFNNGPPPSC
jgi:hypothetical protein